MSYVYPHNQMHGGPPPGGHAHPHPVHVTNSAPPPGPPHDYGRGHSGSQYPLPPSTQVEFVHTYMHTPLFITSFCLVTSILVSFEVILFLPSLDTADSQFFGIWDASHVHTPTPSSNRYIHIYTVFVCTYCSMSCH